MNGDESLLIGIDIGGTNLKALLVDESLRVINRAVVRTPALGSPSALIPRIEEVVSGLTEEVPRNCLAGVGVGIPGLVDSECGIVRSAMHLSGWSDVPLQSMLEAKLSVPVRIDHDLKLITLGEMSVGAGRGYRDFVNAAIGTGVGLSIVIAGEIYDRPTGDWGHATIDYKGERCVCGNVGCLEHIASGPAIARRARERLSRENSLLSTLHADVSAIEAKDVFDAAKLGDKLSQEVVKEAGEAIGAGVVNLIAILNPEVVIIGGGVARSGDILFSQIRRFVAQRSCFCKDPDELIVPAQLGQDAGCIGAVLQMTRRMTGDWRRAATSVQGYALDPSF